MLQNIFSPTQILLLLLSNMRYTFILISAIFSILTFSCRKEDSEKINQDEIWADYRLIYSGELDSTYSRVSFKHNEKYGESLKLSSKSTLTIDGNEPDFNGVFMWYQSVVKGFDSLVEFTYIDLDNQTYKNTLQIPNTIELPNIDTIYKDSSIYFPWSGNSIQEDEVVWFVVDGGLENKIPYISVDSIGNSGLYIVTDSLKGLPPGDVSIHFERWYKNSVNGNSVGSMGYGHYISKKKQVKLVTN